MKSKISFLRLILAFSLFHMALFAQNGTIRGIVYDETLEHAMGSSVLFVDSQLYAVSRLFL